MECTRPPSQWRVPAIIAFIIIGSAAAQPSTPSAGQGASKSPPLAYPLKPIRLIVPFAAGGGTDILARLLGQRLTETMGQPFVVDNRGGAGGVIGAELAAKSPADGYTIVLGSPGPLAINPNLLPRMPYDSLRDFAPITLATISAFTLVVHPVAAGEIGEGAGSAREIETGPVELRLGRQRVGRAFLRRAVQGARRESNLVHVPYKGSDPSLIDLIAGQLQLTMENMPVTLPHVRSGRLRMLAVGTKARSAFMPEVPTIAEAGVPGYESSTAFGVLAPAKTPGAIVTRLNAEIAKVLRSAGGEGAVDRARDGARRRHARGVCRPPQGGAREIRPDREGGGDQGRTSAQTPQVKSRSSVPPCLFLARFARGVFGVARGLLIPFKRCIGLHLGNALGVLARLFFRDSACLPSFLSRAFCVSPFGRDPVRRSAFGRADLARACRFHPCSLPLGGLWVVSQRRCAYLFQLGLLSLGRRLQALREIWFFTRHVFDLSFQAIV